MSEEGFAVAAFREGAQWRVEPLPPTVLGDLVVLLAALRSQPQEGGPFVVACVSDEFFVLARQQGRRISLLLSDLAASVEFPLAEQVIARLGEEPPADDELDDLVPVGDVDILSDLGIGEEELEDLLDDVDAAPEELLETIADRLEIDEQFARATDAARVGPR